MSDKIPSEILETFPKKIYLQTTGKDSLDKSFDELEGDYITWCNQKEFGSDVEYTRSDLASKTIDELEKSCDRWKEIYDKDLVLMRAQASTIAEQQKVIEGSELLYNKQTNVTTALQSSLAEKENRIKYYIEATQELEKAVNHNADKVAEKEKECEELKRKLDSKGLPPHLEKIFQDYLKENDLI